MASASATGKLSREEFRRQKDLDAARKAGTAPAALDEEGKAINPHIPQYIAQAPWYLDTGAPSLSHQRMPEYDHSADKLDNWYDRGAKAGPAAKKYRKGACENCGAMSHKRQDCLERPRRKGAKYTNSDIAPDEVIQEVASGYDAKRDRWNGYDPAEHRRVYEEYAAVEAARQKLREDEIDKQTTTDLAAVRKVAKVGKGEGEGRDDDFGSSDEEDEDQDKYAEAADAVGQKLDTKTRITVRNLRIREDTAKYLINLDPSSAYYDPKTRSMRDNPMKNVSPEEARFAGENFLRYSGEAPDVQKLQLFAWNAAARGNDVHMNANPTQGQLLHQEYEKKKEQLKDSTKVSILAKYGGEEYLEKASKELLRGQTEEYLEYSRTGQVIMGKERAMVRSKYPEDVFVQCMSITIRRCGARGTTPRPGSGLRVLPLLCAHVVLHGPSGYRGRAGVEREEPARRHVLVFHARTPTTSAARLATPRRSRRAQEEGRGAVLEAAAREGDVSLNKDRLAAAVSEERKRKARGEDGDDRFGKRQKGGTSEVTEEELEAYRMNRRMTEDPMANYVDNEL
ncbi:Pre-mRNA-splicing factor SLU7 [Grifola frondosa]|uniref:Pre-mRNA-splicing factor SLU7 n=1 Tax=Grifola frondosa TaxID=5627 RepID=A0A1C7LU36_GRIFR|nr:Pre-mRNA-splicing factor SLU7 [Grifola frondosa]